MISSATTQKIQSRIDIVDILSDFVSLKKRGANYIGLCPFHGEKTPSFTVSESKQIYKCFGCGKSGSAITFLMEHEKYSYAESLLWLAHRYGIEVEQVEVNEEEKQEREKSASLAILNAFASAFFHEQLFNSEEGKTIALPYLEERGFSEETLRAFQIGYCPKRPNTSFVDSAKKRQFDDEILLASGLVARQNERLVDNYSGRIIFPIQHINDKIAGFGARTMSADKRIPKYINTPQNELYNKSAILYGLQLAKKEIVAKKQAIIVEGYTDVISMAQAGIKNTVATGGTSLTVEHTQLIAKFADKVLLFYDSDEAGQAATLKAINLFIRRGLEVYIVAAPQGEDPDSFIKQHNAASFEEYLAEKKQHFLDYQISAFIKEGEDINAKSIGINAIAETLSNFHNVKDLIKRQEYIKEAARKTDTDPESINRLVNLHLRAQLKQSSSSPKQMGKELSEIKESVASSPSAPTLILKKGEAETLESEKRLVFILLQHGEKKWDERADVATYVFEYLAQKRLLQEIKNKTILAILSEYKSQLDKGIFLSGRYFLYHADSAIRHMCVDICKEIETPSHGWRNRVLSNEEEENKAMYLKDTETMLCLLSIRIVKKLIRENNELDDDDTLSAKDKEKWMLETHYHLKNLEMQFAKQMGIVIMQ